MLRLFSPPRYISKEILTIREAVWLTDNTYQYEDLVRMMGEVISVLEGKIRVSESGLIWLLWLIFITVHKNQFLLGSTLKYKMY